MIDLDDYYKNNIKNDDYYYRFYEQLITIPEREQKMIAESFFSEDDVLMKDTRYEIFDEEDAINRFKKLCEPNEDMISNKDNINLFYLLAFYLKDRGYKIQEFPRILERPPLEPYQFTYDDIRNMAIQKGMVCEDGTVKFDSRRKIVANFHFIKEEQSIKIDEKINKKFQQISTRNATFEAMTTDEKIKEIINLMENLLKKDGKYIKLDYSKIALDTIDEDTMKKFKNKIQCFRHSSDEALKERKKFTEKQKKFIIDYGIMLCNLIYYNVNE